MNQEIRVEEFTGFSLEELRESQKRYARRFENLPVIDVTPLSEQLKQIKMVATANPVTATPPEILSSSVMAPRDLSLIMNYKVDNAHIDARRLLTYILMEIEDRKTVAQAGVPFRFTWSKEQGAIIKDLLKHGINDPTSSIPRNKGWYLWGDMRKGKTLLATALSALHEAVKLVKRTPSPKLYAVTDVRQLYSSFASVEKRPTIEPYKYGDRCFDDVGTGIEIEGLKVFGSHFDPMAEILWARHERWTRFGHITYFTSNIPFEGVTLAGGEYVPGYIDRFDERLQARLKEMVHPVLLPS